MTIGKTVAPNEDPMETNPMAVPRLNLNQCATMVVVGPNIPPHANYMKSGTKKRKRYANKSIGLANTHSHREALAMEKLPILFTFGDEEGHRY